MPLQVSKKTFPFRNFRGKELTLENLREELERMYKYMEADKREYLKEISNQLDTKQTIE